MGGATAEKLLHINLLLLGLRPDEYALRHYICTFSSVLSERLRARCCVPIRDGCVVVLRTLAVVPPIRSLTLSRYHAWTKHKVEVAPSMFDSRNRKGLEVILKFLFEKLDPSRARAAFKFCWPVTDKKQETAFRKAAVVWLAELANEFPEAGLSKAPAAVLLSPSGHKVHALLIRFSTLLLQREADQLHSDQTAELFPRFHSGVPPTGPRRELRVHALKSHIARLSTRFVEHAQGAVRVQQTWRLYAVHLARSWRQTAKIRRVVEARVAELKASGHDRVKHRDQDARLARLRESWAELDAFWAAARTDIVVLDDVMGGRSNRVHLDAAAVKLDPPLSVVHAAEKLSGVGDCYDGGRLSLTGFFQLWAVALDGLATEVCRSSSQSQAKTDEVATLVHRHRKYLAQAQELHSELSGGLSSDLVESTNTLASSVKTLQSRAGLNPRWGNAAKDAALSHLPHEATAPSSGGASCAQPDTDLITATDRPREPTSSTAFRVDHGGPATTRVAYPTTVKGAGPAVAVDVRPTAKHDSPHRPRLEIAHLGQPPSISSIYDDVLASVELGNVTPPNRHTPPPQLLPRGTPLAPPSIASDCGRVETASSSAAHLLLSSNPSHIELDTTLVSSIEPGGAPHVDVNIQQLDTPRPSTRARRIPPRATPAVLRSPGLRRGKSQFTPSPGTANSNCVPQRGATQKREVELLHEVDMEVSNTDDGEQSESEEVPAFSRAGIIAPTLVLPNGFASPPRKRPQKASSVPPAVVPTALLTPAPQAASVATSVSPAVMALRRRFDRIVSTQGVVVDLDSSAADSVVSVQSHRDGMARLSDTRINERPTHAPNPLDDHATLFNTLI